MKKRIVKRWIWGILSTIGLIILLGQATLLFFGDEILKESILQGFRRYSESAFEPSKRPNLDFDNLSINIFTAKVSVTGLYFSGYLNIDTTAKEQADYIQISVPKAEIKGVNFLDIYRHQQVRLEEIAFHQPEIQWLSASASDTGKRNTRQVLQTLSGNFQQQLSHYLHTLSINTFSVIDGNLFVTQQDARKNASFANRSSAYLSNKFHAQHVNVILYGFLLDSLSPERKDRVFFTKDIDIQLGDYQLLLSDSSYLVKADTLGFSTRRKKIYLKELQMLPVSSGINNDLRIKIPEVSLTEIDWRDLYFDSLLVANQLVFTRPSVLLKIRQDSLQDKNFFRLDTIHPDSLYKVLSDQLSRLQIKDIVFEKGNLQVHQYGNDTLALLQIKEADLLLASLKLGSTLDRDSLNAILPADTVALNLKKIKIYLPDQKHYFTAAKASLSTNRTRNYACNVRFDTVLFKAGVDSLAALLLAPPPKPLAYDVSIPSVTFFGIQLETMAREHAALLDSIYVKSPNITIANFAPQSVGKQASGMFQQIQADEGVSESVRSLLFDWSNAKLNLYPIIAPGDSSALFQWLKAGELQIDSGEFHILKAKDDLSGFTQITSVDTFYAYLNNISIDRLEKDIAPVDTAPVDTALVEKNTKVAVLATDVDVFLQNSKFLLPGERGEGGLLSVKDARLITQKEEAYLKNVYFWSNAQNPPASELWLHKMYIPYVQFDKVDLKKIYLEQEAYVAYLAVYSPQITLNYKENDKFVRDLDFDFEDVYPQLSPYLKKLSVPTASIKNAKFLLQKISNKGVEPLFTTGKLDIQLKGFYLDSLTRMSRVRPFYADILDVKAEDYQWNFYPEDETYPLLGVKGGSIHYNSYEGQLDINKLTMVTNIADRPELHSLGIYCDKIMADDIDPYRLIHDQLLQVGRLTIKQPSYQVEERLKSGNAHSKKVPDRQFLQPDLNKLLNKNLQNIHLRYVNVEKGKLTYLQKLAADTLSFVSVDAVEFKARNIMVNNQKNRHLHHILYADDIDFSFSADHLLFNKGESEHKVELKDAYFSSTDAHLAVGKLQITPPNQVFEIADKTHYGLSTSNLNLRGLDFKQAYLYGNFNVHQINISDADLKVFLAAQSKVQKEGLSSIHEVISPYLENLRVDKIIYPRSSLEIYDKKSRKISFASSKVNAEISNFYLDQSAIDRKLLSTEDMQQSGSDRLFFADDISITIKDYSRSLDDGLYILSADAIKVESGKKKVGISGLKLQPQLSRSQLLKKYTYSKSLAHLYVDQLTLNEVDFKAILENKKFVIGQMNVHEPILEVFRDNRLPRDASRKRGLHQELLFELDYLMNIHQLQITDGTIAYSERATGGEKDGVITFEALNATASHLTNDPAAIQENLTTTLDIDALVMGEGKLKTSFRFPLESKDLSFYVNGTLGKMDLTKFNQMLEPVAFIHIKEGINQGMRFDFSGDKEKSTGTMEFRYNDLSIQLKDKEKGNSGLDEKLGTFIANAFVLKANNPKAVFLRIGNIEYERDASRAMFHYWWQSILSGVKSSIGLEKNMEKTKDFAELKND